MFFNQVTLAGEIVTEPKLRHAKREPHEKPMPVRDFKLRTLRRQWKHERCAVRVVVFGGGAEVFAQHKKLGDYVLVSGRLCQSTFTGKEGSTIEHHYVVAEEFRFLWGPPGKFLKGHVLIPRDLYQRWQALDEEAGPFHVPGSVQRELDLILPEAPELRSMPEDARADLADVAALSHKHYAAHLDDPSVDMPGRRWGYEPSIKRAQPSPPQKRRGRRATRTNDQR